MVKNKKHKFNRKYEIRNEYKQVFIFAEGEKTEVNYFEAKRKEIRKVNIKVVIKGTGHNTLSLVDYALEFISENNIKLSNSAGSDECWVVFDRDDFRDFDNAIRKAESGGLKVAYSNECFELWFLLHFNFIDTAIGRKDYIIKLDDKINDINGQNYQKNSEDMYSLLYNLENGAIKNSKKLLETYSIDTPYSKKNPSTTVHLLVESLNELKK